MAAKMVILAQREDGTSHEECIEYMETEHAPLVEEMDGVQTYTYSIPFDPDRSGVDYVAQLHFESPAAMDEAFGSDAGSRVQDDAASFLDMDATEMVAVGEETTYLDRSE
ncbi:EthD family reductase [Halostella sp. PRR32]|uniref:EthD family reductase n=1 Tax=Halostella sp. PRR32 TaxID=3098147 RepID=UPI002B1D129B|nr:EthD family reductase [Halostella sp. PRR32]